MTNANIIRDNRFCVSSSNPSYYINALHRAARQSVFKIKKSIFSILKS